MAVPSWKQAILDKRKKQEEEEQRRKKDEEAKLSKIPAWKRSILQRKDDSKAPGQKSSIAKAAFSLKASAMKPQERTTPSDSKAKPSSEPSTAKPTGELQKVDESSQPKAKTANGAPVVEGNPNTNTTTPPCGKASLRRTASSDSAPSNTSPPDRLKRWPVVQPPITLVQSSSSPRNTKREIVQEVGVSEATQPSEDSPTLSQRKEAYQSQVAKASPSPTKQRKMNKTSPLLKEKKFSAEDPSHSKAPRGPVRRGSVKSLMGLFQGGSRSDRTVNSTTSTAQGMVSKDTEQRDMATKSTQNSKTDTVSTVAEIAAVAPSTTQNSKTESTVPRESKSSASPPAAPSPATSSAAQSAVTNVSNSSSTSVAKKVESLASQEHKKQAQPSDLQLTALKEQSVDKPAQTSMVNDTEKSSGTATLAALLFSADSDTTIPDQKDVDHVETGPSKIQSSAAAAHSPLSNVSITQWEEEDAEELTVTSIDDIDTTDEEDDQSQEKKPVENASSSPLSSTRLKATEVQSTDVKTRSVDVLSPNSNLVHERRSSATLEPKKLADVSAVIGDAGAASALNSAASSAQNSDSESTEPTRRRKSSLVDRTKPRVHKLAN